MLQDVPPTSHPTTSRPPTVFEKANNAFFRGLATGFAALSVLLLLYIILQIAIPAAPTIQTEGLSFLTTTKWDPNTDKYGILPAIWGTLSSSVLALLLGSLFGVAVAIFLTEGFLAGFVFGILKKFGMQFHPVWGRLPAQLENLLANLIQLLAAIPSVVYGLWGIFVVIPAIRPAADWLHNALGGTPVVGWLFSTRLQGPGLFPAALVLAIMILPTIAAIARDSLEAVPHKIKEAAYGLGATRWEAILGVFLPTAAPGIWGGIILAFGRALGETMALAMLAGGTRIISISLFDPVTTLAALLALEFPEANYFRPEEIGRLMYAALVLLAITLIVNVVGTLILQRSQAAFKGAR
jgi:phosphate transport system permease protein